MYVQSYMSCAKTKVCYTIIASVMTLNNSMAPVDLLHVFIHSGNCGSRIYLLGHDSMNMYREHILETCM